MKKFIVQVEAKLRFKFVIQLIDIRCVNAIQKETTYPIKSWLEEPLGMNYQEIDLSRT